jgi:indole-3-glycerol phosphate synthase
MLDEIVAHKREETRERQAHRPLSRLQELAAARPPARPFGAALRGADVAVIAEVKRRSPSKGPLAPGLVPADTARLYEGAGAAAISVLTDARYFGASLDDLEAVRGAVDTPVLRKDFILGEYQVLESRAFGADALLLIAAALGRDDLSDLVEYARILGMEALVEVHDEAELDAALDAGAPLIGINNRDLRTFETDLGTTRRLAPLVPDRHLVVSESGIRERRQVEELRRLGVRAVLVGEALVTAPSPAAKLRELAGR